MRAPAAAAQDVLNSNRFRVKPSCHAFNTAVAAPDASPEAVEAVIGFSSGELVLQHLVDKKTLQFNKNGVIADGAVTYGGVVVVGSAGRGVVR